MQILITGGTGFIGTYLCDYLLQQGHFLRVVTRSPERYQHESAKNYSFVGWDQKLNESTAWADVVINLAGENLFDRRWTEEIKQRIYDSRIQATEQLVKAMQENESSRRPELFISGSAVGYYGETEEDEVADESYPSGDDFLSEVCVDWEAASHNARELGIRVVNPRIGIALETDGGALGQMMLPFKLFAGGPIGSGDQFMPWIHMMDLVRGLWFPVAQSSFEGAYNLCAPHPVSMSKLAKTLGEVLGRPSWIPVPEFALRLTVGEAAEFITANLNVIPQKLLDAGFEFNYEYIDSALYELTQT